MGTRDGWRERELVSAIVVVGSFVLAVAALTYFAVHKMKPESFKISATITKGISFAIEIKSSPVGNAEAPLAMDDPRSSGHSSANAGDHDR
jgi:hypothetical protein